MKKKLFKKILIVGAAVVIVGIPILYGVVTSSFFIKAAILPIASGKAGFDIRAKDVNLSLMGSSVSVTGLEAGPEGKPFAKVAKIEAAWGLREIISGNIKLDKLHVSDGDISINEETLKSLMQAKAPESKPEDKKDSTGAVSKSAEPQKLKLDIKDIAIERINVSVALKDTKLDAKNLSVNLPALKTGEDAALSVAGEFSFRSGKDVHVEHCALKNRIAFSLSEDLKPAYVDYVLKIDEFTGRIKDIKLEDRNITAALKSKFDKSLNSSTIEEFYIRESAGGKVVTSAALSGHVSLAPLKLDLTVDVPKISPELIYSFTSGLEIGAPEPSLSAKVFLDDGKVKSSGFVAVKSLKPGKGNVPKVDVKTEFDVTADINKKSAGVTTLSVSANEGANKLLGVSLSKPAGVSWADGKVRIEGDSPELKAQISALDIATVSSFLPPDALPITEGRLSVVVDAKVDKNGQDISAMTRVLAHSLKLKGYGEPNARYRFYMESPVSFTGGKVLNVRRASISLQSNDSKQSFISTEFYGKFDTASGDIDSGVGIGVAYEAVSLMPEKLRTQKFWKLIDGYGFSLSTTAKGNIKKKNIQVAHTQLYLRGKDSGVSLAIKDPVNVNYGEKISGLKDFPFKAAIKINRYPLARVNYMMPEAGVFNLLSGVVTSKLDVVNDGKDISAKGAIAAKGLSFSVNKENYSPMNLVYRTDSKMPLDFEGVTINGDSLELSSASGRGSTVVFKAPLDSEDFSVVDNDIQEMSRIEPTAAFIKFKGPMVFKDFSTDLDIVIEKLDSDVLNVLPKKLADSTKLKKFSVKGKSRLEIDSKKKLFQVDGALAAREILTLVPALKPDKPVNADITFAMLKEDTTTDLKSFKLKAFDNPKAEFLDLSGSCKLKQENGVTDILLKLVSENIDAEAVQAHLAEKKAAPVSQTAKQAKPKKSTWKKSAEMVGSFLETAMNALKGVATSTVTERQEPVMISDNLDSKEPAAIDLKWLKFKSEIDLKKITWTKNVTASLNSRASVLNNVIRDNPLIKINDSPVNAQLMLNPGHSDGYPFDVKLDIKKLDLAPLFKAGFKNNLSESKGKIDSLWLDVAGKGFSPANMQNKMKASFNMQSSDILIKSDIIDQSYILQILFLPLEVFGEMQSFLPANSCSREMAGSISQVRSSINNISFTKGSIKVVSDRKIYIKECEFNGPFIKKLKLDGTAGFNQNLFLTSTLNVGNIIMPMDINGTFSNPEPDINKMIPDFLRQNASNIINTQKDVRETIQKIGTEIQDGLKGLEGLKKIKF